MDTTRVTLATTALVALTFAGTIAQAQVWDGEGDGTNWHDPQNWLPDGVPGPTNDVVIPGNGAFEVEIIDQDAECRTLSMPVGISRGELTIKGRRLTLGQDGTTTSSEAWIDFEESGGLGAELAVRSWVEFVGQSRVQASPGPNPTHWPTILRASGGSGIITKDFTEVLGHLHFLCSVNHQGEVFAVDDGKVMKFGNPNAPLTPEILITGAALNAKSFDACGGRMEFHAVKFTRKAPQWVAESGEIYVSKTSSNVYNDVTIGNNGVLTLVDDFTCNGRLFVDGSHSTSVTLARGKLARFEPGITSLP